MSTLVLVCRVGERPFVASVPTDPSGGHLRGMRVIVGGSIELVELDDGCHLWCNEEGLLFDPPLPINRVIPAAPREPLPPGLVDFEIYTSDDLARPGEPGEWQIRGDFFICRGDEDGNLASITYDDVTKYSALFQTEDAAAAEEMAERRKTLRP